jgi:hypothetical protein
MTAKKKRRTPAPTVHAKKIRGANQAAAGSPAPAPRSAQTAAPAGAQPQKNLSALDAAAQVLRETGQPMNCPELIAQMAAKGYWSSPKGKTPSATLYASLTREIRLKGEASRFVKTGPGTFAYRAASSLRS